MGDDPALIVDRVAEMAIAAVPQRLGPASSESEREAVFRLRYRAVIEMGWAKPEELPHGLERTEDDEHAVQIGAWEGEELVGAARVVPPREGRPLPLERDFGLQVGPKVVEGGRMVIAPLRRGATGHGLMFALFAQCWLETRALGFAGLVSATHPRLIEVYRTLGFSMTELGPAQENGGELRTPVRFEVLASAPELSKLWIAADDQPDRTSVDGL